MPTSWPCALTYCIGGRVGLVDSVRVRGLTSSLSGTRGAQVWAKAGMATAASAAPNSRRRSMVPRDPLYSAAARLAGMTPISCKTRASAGMSAAGSGRRGGRGVPISIPISRKAALVPET